MDLKDGQGRRIKTDDPRFDKVFQICAQYKKPVLIHTADPKQFWEPVDKFNERWIELNEIPGRRRPPERNDPWEMLIAEQHNLFRKHPKTTFINAHLGWFGGDLGRLGRLLDECPNVYTEIGAVLAELGRQPRFARAWFMRSTRTGCCSARIPGSRPNIHTISGYWRRRTSISIITGSGTHSGKCMDWICRTTC
jgi:uncharacterized protein